MESNAQLETALKAVAAACLSARQVQARLGALQEVTKDDRSPVTAADFACQAVVAMVLRRLEPGLLMVGEERSQVLREAGSEVLRRTVLEAVAAAVQDADLDGVLGAIDAGSHDASAERYWTLDPIDGTKGFLRRGQYAISLALIERGEVVLGVLGCPNLSSDFRRAFDDPDPSGLIFTATRGGGAWVVPADRPSSVPFQVWPPGRLPDAPIRACESVEAAHSNQDESAALLARLGASGTPARLDSQCKYAVVARGQADCYLRLPTRKDYVERIWDHAAGMLIAEEAGAIVTDVLGEPLDFSQGVGLSRNRGVICATPAIHARLVELAREAGIR